MSRLNQGENNAQWLLEHSVRARYHASGITKNSGIRIAGGRCLIHARKKGSAVERVSFGDFFVHSCEPIVTTGIVTAHQRRIHATAHGIGRTNPDHRGLVIEISMDERNKKANNIKHSFFVHWMALGY